MDAVLVRYSEIGSKSGPVRGQMVKILRQRVEDRLEYEDAEYERATQIPGRIIVETDEAEELAPQLAELPGVASASPAYETEAGIDSIKAEVERLEVGETFGVRTNRAGEHDFTSREVSREVGGYLDTDDREVDLDDPETWVRIDIRSDRSFVFNRELQGPGGMPVGSQDGVAALISGGIDSPVAAYEMMARGADITPIYFYNRPIAAEDHLIRFQAVLDKLERFHPGKKWEYYVVDMEEVNRELLENIDSGRMVVHRRIMFRVAEKLAEREGLNGLMTGESMGQKSSQTPHNLELTSSAVDKPVHRPLLTRSKEEITEEARKLGTFEEAEVNSACKSLSPDEPATRLKHRKLEKIEDKVDVEALIEEALQETDKMVL